MSRGKEFSTCLHFDLTDNLHRKAVDILENYDKKRYHSYTNFIATALTEYTEHQDDDILRIQSKRTAGHAENDLDSRPKNDRKAD